MNIFAQPKRILLKMVNTANPAVGGKMRNVGNQQQETEALRQRLDHVEDELRKVRSVVQTLNHDLDESRRLNLRAAELMDVAFNQLAN